MLPNIGMVHIFFDVVYKGQLKTFQSCQNSPGLLGVTVMEMHYEESCLHAWTQLFEGKD